MVEIRQLGGRKQRNALVASRLGPYKALKAPRALKALKALRALKAPRAPKDPITGSFCIATDSIPVRCSETSRIPPQRP